MASRTSCFSDRSHGYRCSSLTLIGPPMMTSKVANPDGCEWSVYEGPLFIDFRLPVEWSVRDDHPEQPILPEQIVVGDIGDMTQGNLVGNVGVSLADGDDGCETGEEVIRLAFPELQAAVDRFRESADTDEADGALPEPELRKA